MSEQTNRQIDVIKDLLSVTESERIPIWFYGGFGLDALEGRRIRSHNDIDIFVRFRDQDLLRTILVNSGFTVVEKGVHYSIFLKFGQGLESLTFKRLSDGTLVTDTGETGIYSWPDNSFSENKNGFLAGKPVRAMSWEGLYVFKAGFSAYDPMQPLRDKDENDLSIIRSKISIDRQIELSSFFDPLPGTRKRYPQRETE